MDASDRALERLVFAAEEEHKGMRADSFIAAVSNISRSQIKTVSSEFGLYLDEKQIKISYLVKAGDILTLYLPEPEELDLTPEDIPIDIVYEDDQLAVVNKQQGLTVHPSPTSKSHTLVNALLFRLGSLSGINGVIRPGIVHRLDKNTSGLLVVAKTDAAHRSLARQIATKSAKRIYLALLDGVLKNDEGIVDAPIGRNPRDRKTMAVVKDGKAAATKYKVLERFSAYTFAEFELMTGRTHQIRVHSKYIGHPVVGDTVYGKKDDFNLSGQLLHAARLSFTHPASGEEMTFTAPLPDYLENVLALLRKNK